MHAHSILAVIGRGCHWISEIAGRLGRPVTHLTHPSPCSSISAGRVRAAVRRAPRHSKRSRYLIADPLLRYWYRFVDPNRSLLEARRLDVYTEAAWLGHLAEIGEEIVRVSVSRSSIEHRALAAGAAMVGPRSAGPRCRD
jgi:uncharacterized protein